ncbi:MAG: 16S rRNA (cytosine(1402)-N(4))-methyltransferase RsmH [Candidatus Nanopelagicales bacterium]|nr:16S rRNA (cytosine(1402)-N(4))-methyltransferase RsmH [Candidatus Nanopelagicales bacterium]
MGDAPAHVPVLLARCLELLDPALRRPGAVAVDATLGLGGHAEAMLQAHPGLTVLGLDRDPQALAMAAERLAPFGSRFQAVRAVYDTLPVALAGAGHRRADAILFDLGVSSMQLDLAERGFAYATDAPLDMRMDPTAGATAADLLNTAPAAELARILRTYGEERFASQLARAIVRERERAPFTTSARLVALIRDTIPAPARRTGGNPAKRTFQALRIAVNDELEVLRRAIPAALASLRFGGRMVVLSYHSGEDRIVKRALAAVADPPVPHGLPVIPEELRPTARVLTRGAEKASEDEVRRNPRAASVRLRAVEQLDGRPQED